MVKWQFLAKFNLNIYLLPIHTSLIIDVENFKQNVIIDKRLDE